MPYSSPELLVVMPVYNEQASVRKVAREFFEEVENWTERFVFLATSVVPTLSSPRTTCRIDSRTVTR